VGALVGAAAKACLDAVVDDAPLGRLGELNGFAAVNVGDGGLTVDTPGEAEAATGDGLALLFATAPARTTATAVTATAAAPFRDPRRHRVVVARPASHNPPVMTVRKAWTGQPIFLVARMLVAIGLSGARPWLAEGGCAWTDSGSMFWAPPSETCSVQTAPFHQR